MLTSRLFAPAATIGFALLLVACGQKPTDLSAMAGTYKQGDKTLTVEKSGLHIASSTGSENIQFLTVKCDAPKKCVASTVAFGDATLEQKDKTLSISGSGLAKSFGGEWTAP
jgi:hypothetical protein